MRQRPEYCFPVDQKVHAYEGTTRIECSQPSSMVAILGAEEASTLRFMSELEAWSTQARRAAIHAFFVITRFAFLHRRTACRAGVVNNSGEHCFMCYVACIILGTLES